ncbi:MAG: sulfite exporter TauE/SafE family protein, partial [Comamonadaceae bacterium]
MSFPLITDPAFYAVAIPAVILLGISKSGFGSGFGSLAVPIMAIAIPVPQAAAVLMPVLLVMDALGLHAYRRDFDWALIKFLLPWGLLGTAIGTLLFKALDQHLVAGLVGVCTLGFVAQRFLFPPKPGDAPPPK